MLVVVWNNDVIGTFPCNNEEEVKNILAKVVASGKWTNIMVCEVKERYRREL